MPASKKPIIIVICGGPGVGKSTLAHHLGLLLDIRHGAGTETIVTSLRSMLPRKRLLQPTSKFAHLPPPQLHAIMEQRSKLLSKSINDIFQRCSKYGVPFILEGSHVFPGFIDQKIISLCVTIAAPPRHVYARWLKYPTSKRRIRRIPIQLAYQINGFHLSEAERAGVPIIRVLGIKRRMKLMVSLLKKRGVQI